MSVNVIQNPDKPVEPEVLADAIVRISGGMQRLTASGINRAGIIALLVDTLPASVPRKHIVMVLDSLEVLARKYTVPK